jgi:glutamate synthase domain-containing protein 2
MSYVQLALAPRFVVYTLSLVATLVLLVLTARAWPPSDWLIAALVIAATLAAIGTRDVMQSRHSILRNYPVIGHLRFLFEQFRPEIRQYLFESDKDGTPFSRDRRSIVYQRAKMALDKRPFGTQYDVYAEGYEWMRHSMAPQPVSRKLFRVKIGGPQCRQPYAASVYNISAMSFGALSANAIRALNKGAAMGGFAHDTGEGGVSRYHREYGGDLIWEIGSGYFGCRDGAGTFSPERFKSMAALPQIRMIEIKLSQGAKPGHGGVLPAAKVSLEIAETRGIPEGQDCISPATHPAFSTPTELMQFVARLRDLSGGKPTGFKLCVGHPWEFLAICKAMLETSITPDFIVVDGKEGGTGAAPLEFADHMGMPLREGLNFVHNALRGVGLRDRISIGASGQIVTAFDMARVIALGADWCNSARAFMFAVGCIQSQSCHTDRCPTGVATQDQARQRAVVVPDKAERVRNFHRATLESLAELVAAAGLDHPLQFRLEHFSRRISAREVVSFAELYPSLDEGALLEATADPRFRDPWSLAQSHSFAPATG